MFLKRGAVGRMTARRAAQPSGASRSAAYEANRKRWFAGQDPAVAERRDEPRARPLPGEQARHHEVGGGRLRVRAARRQAKDRRSPERGPARPSTRGATARRAERSRRPARRSRRRTGPSGRCCRRRPSARGRPDPCRAWRDAAPSRRPRPSPRRRSRRSPTQRLDLRPDARLEPLPGHGADGLPDDDRDPHRLERRDADDRPPARARQPLPRRDRRLGDDVGRDLDARDEVAGLHDRAVERR